MRKSPLNKLGKTKTSVLKRKLWKVFSDYIRKRDNYICVTCGKKGEGAGIHAGHYIPKSVGGMALYFDERGTNAQCYRCNIHLSGNWPAYREYIIKKHGKEVEAELQKLKTVIVKDFPYEEKLEEYKKKLEEL